MDKKRRINIFMKPELSIIIPVYNGSDDIPELYERLVGELEHKMNLAYEIIFIDDGSQDNSWNIIESLCNKNLKVKSIKFTRNFGQHPSIMAGLKHANGDGAILMDADLESSPEDIGKLLLKAKEGFDIVHGVREARKGKPARIIGSKIYHWLLNKLLGVSLPDAAAPLRYISRRIIDETIKITEQSRYIVILMMWLGYKQAYVKTKHTKRIGHSSRYSNWKLIKMTVELILGFNPSILRLITWTGLIISFMVFLIGIYFLILKLVNNSIMPGFTSLVLLITFLFGVTFIFLGIISEYLAKLFTASQGRPYYVIDRSCNFEKNNYV